MGGRSAKDLPGAFAQRISPRCAASGGVVDAYATNSFPLSNGGDGEGLGRDPDQVEATVLTAMYYGDEHTLATLGPQADRGPQFPAG